ncbi:hypothetical protein E8E11_003376 [Didymella keratinophila]|nr:hypothetical protein E8E11_003376 [Didymella keratinophila]
MAQPTLVFNYDISCPFAYIASTRVKALADRTNATLIYRPVLLGAIYRATAAPQGAAGSASDVFNTTKKAVTAQSMQRALKRYKIKYSPPPEHPRKSVNALRLLYCVPDGYERRILTDRLFAAYWANREDVTNTDVLLKIAKETGISSASSLSKESFASAGARKELEKATAEAIERGAFGVPGFWIPEARWTYVSGETSTGRFFWGQDRMHFVEATLQSLRTKASWKDVQGLATFMPRCIPYNQPQLSCKVKLEFWYDFSSPWAFLGYTQLPRLQRVFGPNLEIVMKPFLLGILFREIGAPNMPMLAVSPAKAAWSRQDHADWVTYWNAVNASQGSKDKEIAFQWADVFPIRTPTVLRVAIVEPATVPLLYSACWELDANISDENVLVDVLDKAGYNGADLVARANAPAIKDKLRENTAAAKATGICGVPTYRVLHKNGNDRWLARGGLVWGQDETNVVEDLIAGWDPESSSELAKPQRVLAKTFIITRIKKGLSFQEAFQQMPDYMYRSPYVHYAHYAQMILDIFPDISQRFLLKSVDKIDKKFVSKAKAASQAEFTINWLLNRTDIPKPSLKSPSGIANETAVDSINVWFSHLPHNDGRNKKPPRTPKPHRQQNLVDEQDESTTVRAVRRRFKGKILSPANIEGGYEHIDARDATYGGDVSAVSAGSPRANNPGSFAQPPTPETEQSIAVEDSDQRQHGQVESPTVAAERSAAADALLEGEAGDDAALPTRFAGYQGTPEAKKEKKKKKKKKKRKKKKKKKQSKGGASSG